MKITVKWVATRKRWRCEYRKASARHRTFHPSKALAEAEAMRLRGDVERSGAAWVALSAAERSDLMTVALEVQKAGLTLREVWAAYREGKTAKSQPGVSLAAAQAEFLKVQADRVKPRYLIQLRQFIAAFCRGRESLEVATISPADLQSWLDLHSVRHRPTVRGRLIGWFEFCVRRGWLVSNPWNRLEVPRGAPAERRIFTVAQVQTALDWLQKNPALAGWFVLSTFAGLRPEEAMQTAWDAINFDEGWIRVEGQTSKTGLRRVVYPRPGVLDLLLKFKVLVSSKNTAFPKTILPVGIDLLRSERKKLGQALGFNTWPKDITRHTAASMWLASEPDAAKVATMLGHSQTILHRHYKALVTQAESQKFWALLARTTHTNAPT